MDAHFDAQLAQARWAVGRWSGFPVDQAPRPLVLAGPEIVIHKGFRTGEAQDAFREARIEWAVEVPDELRAALRRNATQQPDPSASGSLKITHAGPGEHEFVTDRGPRTLPAWWLQGPATNGPIWVLEPASDRWQPPGGAGGPPPPPPTQMHPLVVPVEAGAEGRSIVFTWIGSPPEIESYPSAEVIESETAVAVVAHRSATEFRGWHTAVGFAHRVHAQLRSPIGARVVVDLHGDAVAVI